MLVTKNIFYKLAGKILLNDVSVCFTPGKLNLILGPNGAGKSTLIKSLCSPQTGMSGDVFYGDRNLKNITLKELAKIRAVLSQNIDLAFSLPVGKVVMMGRYPHFTGKPAHRDYEAVKGSMELFNILDFSNRDYLTLSGGEKQRVQFARVLAQIWFAEPELCRILLLDEPLTYLDIFYQYDFLKKIRTLVDEGNLLVVGVLHDLNLAAKFADFILLLNEGRVVASGKKEEVLTKEYISMAYRMDAQVQHTDGGIRLLF